MKVEYTARNEREYYKRLVAVSLAFTGRSLTPIEMEVLVYMLVNNTKLERTTRCDLAALIRRNRAYVSVVISNLVKKGFLEHSPKRVSIKVLSPAMQELRNASIDGINLELQFNVPNRGELNQSSGAEDRV